MLDTLRKRTTLVFLIIAVVLVIPSLLGLIHLGLPITDDGSWMTIRFSAFYEALRSGQFPVRFLMRLNNGFGYPVADFLYPLYMYIGVPINIAGISFVNTVKIIFFFCMIFLSIFSFLWLRKFFDNLSSLIGATFYSLSPYHLFDLYKRGSLGEVLSLSILPFILWQLERKSLMWSAVGIAALITAHNTLAVLFLVLIISYFALDIYIAKDRAKLARYYFVISVLGFGLSAFFWLPAFLDLSQTVFNKTQVSNWSAHFSSLQLLGLSTVTVLISVLVFILAKKIDYKKHRLTLLFFTLAIVSAFFSSELSVFLWKYLPVSFIQFPFRLLSITLICGAFLTAAVINTVTNKYKVIVSVFLLMIIFVSAVPYIVPKEYQYFDDSFYSTNQDTTTVKNEYMPKWVKKIPSMMAESRVENLKGKEKINITKVTPNETAFNVNLSKQGKVKVNTIYFPGWVAFVNGQKTNIMYDNQQGVIMLSLNKGQNNVRVKFEETNIRTVADIISLISFIVLILLSLKIKNKKINL